MIKIYLLLSERQLIRADIADCCVSYLRFSSRSWVLFSLHKMTEIIRTLCEYRDDMFVCRLGNGYRGMQRWHTSLAYYGLQRNARSKVDVISMQQHTIHDLEQRITLLTTAQVAIDGSTHKALLDLQAKNSALHHQVASLIQERSRLNAVINTQRTTILDLRLPKLKPIRLTPDEVYARRNADSARVMASNKEMQEEVDKLVNA